MRMKKTPRFLSVNNALQLHSDTISQEGGGAGIREPGLLESAVLMAQQQFGGEFLHPTISEMAAAYHFHLCMNHPFVDGNKRAAVLAMLVFLDLNGVKKLPPPKWIETTTLKVASGAMGKSEFTQELKKILNV